MGSINMMAPSCDPMVTLLDIEHLANELLAILVTFEHFLRQFIAQMPMFSPSLCLIKIRWSSNFDTYNTLSPSIRPLTHLFSKSCTSTLKYSLTRGNIINRQSGIDNCDFEMGIVINHHIRKLKFAFCKICMWIICVIHNQQSLWKWTDATIFHIIMEYWPQRDTSYNCEHHGRDYIKQWYS